ncbi:DinB family protein [Rufibacter roseus]|uniref:DinB family protein n=1 Tax=Rufibacter roseus TaxID=1567108 RepID=A0ABW2DT10_9BACT|nr:DinB family protein [Rufibacter roseus]
MIQKPQPGEYNPYYEPYLQLFTNDTDVLDLLQKQQQEVVQLLGRVTEGDADFAYEPGKWSIKELLGHMNDTEKIMAYRALCVARGENQPLPGFDENTYVANSNFKDRTLSSLLEEHAVIRANSVFFFNTLSEETFSRIGNANGSPVSVAALAFIIAGHERHHLNILKERYLVKI